MVPVTSDLNLLFNPSFKEELAYWQVTTTEASSTVGVDFAQQWSVEGGSTAYLFSAQPDETPVLFQDVDLSGANLDVDTNYQISGFFGTHRTDILVEVIAIFSDGDESSLSEYRVADRPDRLGGVSLNDYQFAVFFAEVPGRAKSVRISLSLGEHSGEGEPGRFGFVTHMSMQPASSQGVMPSLPVDVPAEQLDSIVPWARQGSFIASRFPVGAYEGRTYGPALSADEWSLRRLDGCNLITGEDLDSWISRRSVGAPQDTLGVDLTERWKIPEVPTIYWAAGQEPRGARLQRGPEVPVVSGARYELGAYMAYHRCEGNIGVEWIDREGDVISTDELSVEDATRIGGTSLSEYDHQLGLVRAPEGATTACVFLARSGTLVGHDSFMFMALPFFAPTSRASPEGNWNEVAPEDLRAELALLADRSWIQCADDVPDPANLAEEWKPTSKQCQTLLLVALANHDVDEVFSLLKANMGVDVPPGALEELVDQLLEREEFESAVHTAFYAFVSDPSPGAGEKLNVALKTSAYGSIADLYEAFTMREPTGGREAAGYPFGYDASAVPGGGVVGFSGNSLIVWYIERVRRPEDFAVRIDGEGAPGGVKAEEASPVETIAYARVRLPDTVLDASERRVEFVDLVSGRTCWSSRVAIDLRVNIEQVAGGRIRGWVASSVDMDHPPELVAMIDGRKALEAKAVHRRSDVEQALGDPFSTVWAFDLAATVPRGAQLVEIGFPGSDVVIEGAGRWLLERQSAVNTVRSLRHQVNALEMPEPAKQWLSQTVLPSLLSIARGGDPAGLEALQQKNLIAPRGEVAKRTDSVIDVVVPVYRDLEATRGCLEAVLKARVNRPFHVIAINDASPESKLAEWLEEFCADNGVELIVHKDNRGFPATANAGMAVHPDRDVVLLNSDAIVSDGWLDELQNGAYSSSEIASVTAMSNSATVFSYPVPAVEQEIPEDTGRDALAALALEQSAGEYVTSPTCHGFCVYLRREALDDIGTFDQAAFTKGYGEETDWSQRANDRGWRHVAAPGVFVEHLGSRSFKGDRTALLENSFSVIRDRYPEYDAWIQDFIHSDPLAVYRRRLDRCRIRAYGDDFTLHITHHLGGGTEKHVRDLTVTFAAQDERSLVLQPDPLRTSTHVVLTCPGLELEATYAVEDEYEELIADLKHLGVSRGHLHHLIGFAPGLPKRLLTDLGVAYSATVHDYAAACPRIFITRPNGDFCDGPRSKEECGACIAKHGPLEPAQGLFDALGGTIDDWRESWQEALDGADKLLFPTSSHLQRFAHHLDHPDMRVAPHPEEEFPSPVMPERGKGRYTVALLGGLSWEKGFGRLRDLAALAEVRNSPLDFVVIGPTADDAVFSASPNVRIHGLYQPGDTQSLLEKYRPDTVLFLSVWPETWCYTLSESLKHRLTVVAPRLGAFEDRLTGRVGATLFDPSGGVEGVLEALHEHLGVDSGAYMPSKGNVLGGNLV